MKKCPFCAEEIQADAIKCRFCNELLKKKYKWLNCFSGCFMSAIISAALCVLFIYVSFFLMKLIVYKMFFAGPNYLNSHTPFTGGGIEGMLKEFGEAFKGLWERFSDFMRFTPENRSMTF